MAGHSDHIVPVRLYVLIWLALVIGTVVTWAVAYVNLGRWNVVVALVIACIKASLVVLFFMHIFYSTKLVKAIIVTGFCTLLILFLFTSLDLAARGNLNSMRPWIGVPGR